MTTHHETLGITPDATPAQAKAAYHKKLREFPAHTHPTEFKAVRAAYESIQTGSSPPVDDFFKMKPIQETIDPVMLQTIKKNLIDQLDVSLDDMLRNTF
jgi:hypothetical protein